MATVRKEVRIEARAETVWDALRDFGALATRLAPGFAAKVAQLRRSGAARALMEAVE